MTQPLRRIPLVLTLVFAVGQIHARAPGEADSLRTAELMNAALYPQAIAYVDSICLPLRGAPEYHGTTALYMREQQAYAYDRLRLEERALVTGRAVAEDAGRAGDSRTEAEARLTIALVQEKHGLHEKCREELARVERILNSNDHPATRARYYVRLSSYHRIYAQTDSAIHFARLALAAGYEADNPSAVADGVYLITSMAPLSTDSVLSIYRDAVEYTRRRGYVQKYTALSQILVQIEREAGSFQAARERNAELLSQLQGELQQHGDHIAIADALRFEAEELIKEGRYAQAIPLLQEVAYNEGQFWHNRYNQRVQEVEAKYDIERKDAEIAAQLEETARQKARSEGLLRGLLVVMGLLGMLLFQAYRLRRARRSISRQADELSTVNESLEEALLEQKLLRSELHHRVKNNLQVIISLLDLQEDRELDLDTKSTLRSTSERVYSIAAVHDMLSPDQRTDRLDLDSYLRKIADHSLAMWPADRQPLITVEVGDAAFSLDTLVPLGVVVSELFTNTRKYYGDRPGIPKINVRLQREEDEVYTLRYRDNGAGFPRDTMEQRPGGLGTYLIRSMARQLEGSVVTWNDHGAVTEFSFREKIRHQRPGATTQNKIPTVRNMVAQT